MDMHTPESWHPIASDTVEDAKKAGFRVGCYDISLTGNPLLDRTWYAWANEDDLLSWIESHQL